jgi:hypothetical protein
MSIIKGWSCVGVGIALLVAHGAATALEKINPGDLDKPTVCPAFFKFDKGACVALPGDVPNPDKDTCPAAGFELGKKANNEPTCVAVAGAPVPKPECNPLPGFAGKIKDSGKEVRCVYEATLPVSAPGDYLGDCFKIKAVPTGTSLAPGRDYFVSAQRELPGDDRDLTLVPGHNGSFPLGCKAVGGPQHRVNASTLVEAGASRHGYAYGFLTMPYKYFPGQKSFQVNVPIGGYLGWRRGQAGSGVTTAFAVTLSSVKANTVDPKTIDPTTNKPAVTGTADVAALAGAFGVVFDVLKSGRGKPFKAGIFIGKDAVSRDPTIDYRFNRKTWIAIQLGYDFTDN